MRPCPRPAAWHPQGVPPFLSTAATPAMQAILRISSRERQHFVSTSPHYMTLTHTERVISRMKILVTGGAGFIGSHIVDQYIAAGHDVAVVDNLWEEGGGKEANLNPKAHFYRVDITDEADLQSIFDEI